LRGGVGQLPPQNCWICLVKRLRLLFGRHACSASGGGWVLPQAERIRKTRRPAQPGEEQKNRLQRGDPRDTAEAKGKIP